MRLLLILSVFFIPYTSFGSCYPIDKTDPRFACVTVINSSDSDVSVTGDPGFILKPHASDETSLLLGAMPYNLIISHDPFDSREDQKVGCYFKIKDANTNNIIVNYIAARKYSVTPSQFSSYCELTGN